MSFDSGFGRPEGYRTEVQSDDSADQSNNRGARCADSRVSSWHPDYSLSSPEARQWHKQNKKISHDPLSLNEIDGTYTVQHGDCLSTIAARELSAEGKSTSKKSIAHEVEQIVALNRDKYSLLDCNKEYLEQGWKLRLPGLKSSSSENLVQQAAEQEADGGSTGQLHRQIPAHVEHHHRYHQSHAQQMDQQQYYSPQSNSQSPDVGQGIAKVLGGVLGGIGTSLLGQSLFGNRGRYGQYGGGYDQYQGGYGPCDSGYGRYGGGYDQYAGGYDQYQGGYNQYQGGYNQYAGGYNPYQGSSNQFPGYGNYRHHHHRF